MTIPVVLAIGERERISGRDLLTSMILGYEVMGKFGSFTWALDAARRPTQPFGAFGAAISGAKALGLNADRMAAAIGYAAHTAMGLAEGDGMVTHWYSLVCRNGLTGAYMAKRGGWSSPTVLEGQWGFLDIFIGLNHNFDGEALLASLGHDYAVNKACEKRYPGTALNRSNSRARWCGRTASRRTTSNPSSFRCHASATSSSQPNSAAPSLFLRTLRRR
jgi:2-methylcitrate dehydratase PrpD